MHILYTGLILYGKIQRTALHLIYQYLFFNKAIWIKKIPRAREFVTHFPGISCRRQGISRVAFEEDGIAPFLWSLSEQVA